MFLLCFASLAGTIASGYLLYPHGWAALLLAPCAGSALGIALMAALAAIRGWDRPQGSRAAQDRPAPARTVRGRGRFPVHRHA